MKTILRDIATIMGAARASDRGSKLLKFLDRYVGIPIVFLLGCLSLFKKKNPPSQIHKIAILKTAAIGDTVLLTAIIEDLKKVYPNCEIHFYSGSSNFGLANLLTQCHKIIQLPIKNPFKLFKIMKLESYDLLLDFGAWPRINSVCSFLARAHFKIGFKTAGQYRHYVYDRVVNHSHEIHEIDNYRNILKVLNIPVGSMPVLPMGSDVSSLISTIQRPFVVCHLWPGGERSDLKEWPRENWQALMNIIIKNKGCDIVMTGGGEDREKNLDFVSQFSNKNHIYDFSGIKLSETISLLKKAQLVISVNTGVMHMAAAAGVKTIGLNGPTSAMRWGPLGPHCRSVNSDLSSCGYLNLGFEYQPELKCMENLPYSKVLDAVNQLL